MSAVLRYRLLRFWSPVLGRAAARISVFDSHGDEHFAVIPMDGTGKANRAARERMLEAIAEHVEAGAPAGEVELDFATRREAA